MSLDDLNQSLRSYLIELGADTAGTVRKFTECSGIPVYEAPPSLDNDGRVAEGYEQAVEACRVWLRGVLAAELVEGTDPADSAEIVLSLPDRTLEVSLRGSVLPFGSWDDVPQREMLVTPIGRLDHFTYQCIIGIKDNPVQLLYRYFQDLIHQLHIIATLSPHNEADDILNRGLVADLGIIDILGLACYDGIWYDVDKFLDDRFAVKGA